MTSCTRAVALSVVLATLALAAAACGGSDDAPTGASNDGAFPVTVEGTSGSVTLSTVPERIVSLSPTATEMLFALGAGDQVVAVDDQSDYPPEAPTTQLSGLQPNLEALADYRPDLVVVEDDAPTDLAKGLDRIGVALLAQTAPDDLEGAYRQIRDLGIITRHRQQAKRVVNQMRSRIDQLVADAPEGGGRTVFHELDPELYTASSDTFIGRIYERLGLRNIADPAADKAGTEYPQLSSEYVVSSDPDVVVLADTECCGMTPARAARRPGWGESSAVRHNRVTAVDDAVASRWGPRVPQFVQQVVRALHARR